MVKLHPLDLHRSVGTVLSTVEQAIHNIPQEKDEKSNKQNNFAYRFLRETRKNTSADGTTENSLSNFFARFQATTNGKITSILAMKESEGRETVDAIRKS